MPGLAPGIHPSAQRVFRRGWMAGHRRAEATPSFGRLCPAMTASFSKRSRRHPCASGGGAFRNDPSVEQIKIDVAAAQNEADALAADPGLLLQRCRERGCTGAFREVMGIGPVGADRRPYLAVGDLHDVRGTLA